MEFDIEGLMETWRQEGEERRVETLERAKQRVADLEKKLLDRRLSGTFVRQRLAEAIRLLTTKADPVRLNFWLKHDSWSPYEALTILCDFDPGNFNFDEDGTPYIPQVENMSYSDSVSREWGSNGRIRLDGLKLDDTEINKLINIDFFHIGSKFLRDYEYLLKIWISGNHGEERHPPGYYVDWAKSKRWKIDWYEWAVKNEYISNVPGTANQQQTLVIEKDATPRERNTLIVLVAALCHEAGIDHKSKSAAGDIEKLTDLLGAKVTDETIRKYLDKIPEVLAARGK